MPHYPKPIHPDDSRESLEKRMRGQPFQNPDQASPALAKVIKKACAYKDNNRYDSPSKMKNDLESVLTNLSDFAKSRQVTLLDTQNASSGQTEEPSNTLLASQK